MHISLNDFFDFDLVGHRKRLLLDHINMSLIVMVIRKWHLVVDLNIEFVQNLAISVTKNPTICLGDHKRDLVLDCDLVKL